MSASGMEAPYSIASIPRPIDDTNGRCHSASVYGIRHAKKRKRHEVVVGVDGESVNLYNIESQRIVTSYALPPSTYLCCPPASVYARDERAQTTQRLTYCVVKDGAPDKRRRLVSITENRIKNTADHVAPKRKECILKEGGIVNVHVVPRGTDSRSSLLVTYSDGSCIAVASDLSKSIELGRPSMDGSEDCEVESAATVDIGLCRKGLLKSRQDVIAVLDTKGGTPTLQWRVIRQGTVRQFQLLALNLSALDGTQSLQRKPSVLMSFELASVSKQGTSAGYYELHAPSGTLFELLGGKLGIYDLSGIVPKLVTRIGSRTAPISSFSRLSSSSVLTIGGGTASVYETKYGSAQASVSLATSTATSQPRKRKHEEIDSELGRFGLAAWFSELRQAVGICGSELVVLQLSNALVSSKRKRGHGIALVDVLGKGTAKESRNIVEAEKRSEKWQQWTATVDDLVSENDIEGLERLIANDKKLGKQRKSNKLEDLDEGASVTYDDVAAYEELWPLPETFDPQNLDQSRIQYLLAKIFKQSETEGGRLEVAIRSPKLMEWLALTGSLSIASLRKAFESAGSIPHTGNKPHPGDIMAAIKEIDDDFQLLHDLFHLPVHWELEEIIQALRIILRSFNAEESAEQQLALPAPPLTNGEVEMTNGDAADSELEVAENELDHAVNALTAGLEVRSDALRSIFARLHALSHLDVTSTMRWMMSQDEIFLLIHILRIELADGGWTSRYIDIGQPEGAEGGMVDALAGIEESGPSDESVKVIGFLLNCAIDAIGVGGWLVGLGGNSGAKDIVESLRAEVSAGYEGCLEANTIKIFLADIEKFAAQHEQALLPLDTDEDEATKAVLPIGGKVVAPTVNDRDGREGPKNKIARAQEKSKRVGKYSIERIRI